MSRIVFRNANLLDGENPARKNMSIVVEGERITDVTSGAVAPKPGDTSVDLQGMTLMPGMVSGHYHAAYSVGGRRPAIVVTSGAVDLLTAPQLGAVLAHERAHLGRRHHRWALAAALVAEAMPLVPLLREAPARVGRLLEMDADERAANDHEPYVLASALVAVTSAGGRPSGGAVGIRRDQVYLDVIPSELYTYRRYAVSVSDDFPWPLVNPIGLVLKGGVAPFGGHKGYGLSFAIQALGILAGAALAKGQVRDYGFLFWAIDPDAMLPGGEFKSQMSEYVRQIKATPRRQGVEEIRIPSERAMRERERRRKEGIVIERKVVESLKAL